MPLYYYVVMFVRLSLTIKGYLLTYLKRKANERIKSKVIDQFDLFLHGVDSAVVDGQSRLQNIYIYSAAGHKIDKR